MKKLVLILMTVFCGLGVYAQQDAQYSMYMFNGLFINPAYAGSKDALALNALYRHQWAGFEGAPRSFSFGAHSPLKKDQYALGVIVTHDQLGVRKFNSLYTSFAFRPKLNENDLRLSLGIQAGFTHFNPDFLSLEGRTNQSAAADLNFGLSDNRFLPNMGAGFMLYNPRFYIGFSVPHLIRNNLSELDTTVNGQQNVAQQFQHYLANVGVVIGKEEGNVKFKPSILMKFVPKTPVDFDFNLAWLFKNRFWLGVSYRTGGNRDGGDLGIGESIIGMFEMKVTQQFAVGYAYDHTLSSLRKANTGTHEIFLGYEFAFEQKRFVNPRYVKYF